MPCTTTISRPKLSSSELSSEIASRSNPHWTAAASTNRAGTVIARVRIGFSPHDEAIWNVRYAPSRIRPKWIRLMIRNTPQVIDRPAAIKAYRPPTSIPLSPACRVFMTFRPGSAGGGAQLRRRPVRRPYGDPVVILNLLDGQRGRPEVVRLRVEGQ